MKLRTLTIITITTLLLSCSSGPEITQPETATPQMELASKTNFNLGRVDYDWYLESENKQHKTDAKRKFELSIDNDPNGPYADSSRMYLDSLK